MKHILSPVSAIPNSNVEASSFHLAEIGITDVQVLHDGHILRNNVDLGKNNDYICNAFFSLSDNL
jgi:hypothetical protein